MRNYQEELKIIKGRDFVFESVDLLDYKLHRVRLKRDGSYIKSPKWLEHNKATMSPKNENDDECLRGSIISTLSYNDIMKKEFETYFKKLNMKIKIFHRIKEIGKMLNKIMNQLLLLSYFHQKNSEETTLLYKSEHNLERENKVLLLMVNDDDEKYYFAVKSKLELHSPEWLRSRKKSITSEDNCFQNALNDSLDYQTIKTHPERISKLKPYINKYN